MKVRRINTKKKNQRMFLLLIILGVTIGFAAIVTTLKINGFSLIGKSTWDIRWDKDSVAMSEDMPGEVPLENQPKVSTSSEGTADDTILVNLNLEGPGDFYEFYVDAVNRGTLDGEIASVTTTWKKDGEVVTTLPECLEYTLVYADSGDEPAVGDLLLKNQTRTYFVRLEYKDGAMADDDMEFSAEIAINYRQKTDEVVPEFGPGSDIIIDQADDPPSPIPGPQEEDAEEDDPEDIDVITNPVRVAQPAVTNNDGINPAGTDYIYTGPQPGNYIYFNCESLDEQDDEHCEVWRIIKIDSDVGNRIKIIRNEPLDEERAWNEDESGVKMSNDWEHSTLKEYLNGEYYNSLSSVSKKLIPTVKWYTAGGYNVTRVNSGYYLANDSTSGMTAGSAYVNERTKFITRDPELQRTDTYAKVGLMYASDYGYASSKCASKCTATGAAPCRYLDDCTGLDSNYINYISDFYEMFYNGDITEYNYSKPICKNSNWLYSGINEWTLTPSMYTVYNYQEWGSGSENYDEEFQIYCHDPKRNREGLIIAYNQYDPEEYDCYYGLDSECDKGYRSVVTVGSDGTTGQQYVFYGAYVRPVVYLKSGVDLEGTGTEDDPYRIIADSSILNEDDHYIDDTTTSHAIAGDVLASHESDSSSCSDRKKPTCTINYVKEIDNGLSYRFTCSDDAEISKVTSLFEINPVGDRFASSTFEAIGTNKHGTLINGETARTYSGKWTTSSENPPVRGTCYYLVFGGEDTCGNWTIYKSPQCYEY